jgi:hypothetical protein
VARRPCAHAAAGCHRVSSLGCFVTSRGRFPVGAIADSPLTCPGCRAPAAAFAPCFNHTTSNLHKSTLRSPPQTPKRQADIDKPRQQSRRRLASKLASPSSAVCSSSPHSAALRLFAQADYALDRRRFHCLSRPRAHTSIHVGAGVELTRVNMSSPKRRIETDVGLPGCHGLYT